MAGSSRFYNKVSYLEPIYQKFQEEYPSTYIDKFIINNVINMFWDYVEDEITQEREVPVFGFGKFKLKQKYVGKRAYNKGEGKKQWFPTFEWTNRAKGRIRINKGTATENEIREAQLSSEFMKKTWEKRYLHMYNKKGYIPLHNLENLYALAAERKDSSYLDVLEKIKLISEAQDNSHPVIDYLDSRYKEQMEQDDS